MRHLPWALALVACAATLSAQTISNDLGSPATNLYNSLTQLGPFGQSFTPSVSQTLTSVTVVLNNLGNQSITARPKAQMGSSTPLRSRTLPTQHANPAPAGGYVSAALYSDASGSPGSLLATSTTYVLDTQLSGSNAQFTFPFSYAVTGGTRYWIILTGYNNTVASWVGTEYPAGTDVLSEFYLYHGSTYPNNSEGAFLMLVTGNGVSPTPAPATLWLALIGLAAAGWYIQRRRVVQD